MLNVGNRSLIVLGCGLYRFNVRALKLLMVFSYGSWSALVQHMLLTCIVCHSLIFWRDAVRGARWRLEYPDLLRDIWASELSSQ